jgi:hypothetical protein
MSDKYERIQEKIIGMFAQFASTGIHSAIDLWFSRTKKVAIEITPPKEERSNSLNPLNLLGNGANNEPKKDPKTPEQELDETRNLLKQGATPEDVRKQAIKSESAQRAKDPEQYASLVTGLAQAENATEKFSQGQTMTQERSPKVKVR